MIRTSWCLLFIAFMSQAAYSAEMRAVYVKRGEVYVSRADGSEARPLTSDKVPKSLPRWSPDGNHIAFVEKLADGSAVGKIGLVRLDGSDEGLFAFRPSKSVLGMRQIEDLTWLDQSRLLVAGSINPNNMEYAIVWVTDGAEGGSFECNSVSAELSPDRKHLACWGAVAMGGTDVEDRFETVRLDGRRIYPRTNEQVALLSMPVWCEDSQKLALLVYHSNEEATEVVVLHLDGPLESFTVPSDIQIPDPPRWEQDHLAGLALFSQDGHFYVEAGHALLLVNENSGDLEPTDENVRRPSQKSTSRHSLAGAIRRAGGHDEDFKVVP